MAASGSGVFENEAADAFVAGLRKAPPTAVGDSISAALRAVAQAETPLTEQQVQRALAALALLLSEFDPGVLDGAGDGELQTWFADLEIELNPARRQVAGAALDRILLPQDNGWFDGLDETRRPDAVASVHRLRDLLADAAADE